MRRYNALENVLLARVLATLDHGLENMGMHLKRSQWFGPGQTAQAWLTNIGAITREEYEKAVPKTIRDAMRASFYGAHFEIMAHGHIPGDTHEYDINSAYPKEIEQLPCLIRGHGKWDARDRGTYTTRT